MEAQLFSEESNSHLLRHRPLSALQRGWASCLFQSQLQGDSRAGKWPLCWEASGFPKEDALWVLIEDSLDLVEESKTTRSQLLSFRGLPA